MNALYKMASSEKAHLTAIIARGLLRNNEILLWEDVKKSQEWFFCCFREAYGKANPSSLFFEVV
jgi:hypothetical protein